ncbi:hypothetical protein SAMN05192558_103242 [Actinokineospora alba]|uniref:Antibiotic biosynthesis monooxygenase n=1 Tax=Actinokineospora alba TaxID=504798 RepID=A0A1H0JX35_9PSEU|nr:hypothetical protein [Actinokineospora alba]TDP68137.1 hypothetical protein C8E96_3700 [Actinokineospora alba]SDH92999.1 hypothetical protein SAMN05421871_102807 [Actinokineospora alba]SDO47951.1 hypothetical protein SAMN05192558_103242 [Actinokineospora alba]
MFMQIIQGRVRDTEAAKAALDRWQTDLAPGAEGWLGGTYGVTDDRMMVAAVRFESREAAQRNSDRPEQSSWWAEMERCFDGEVTFHDCDDVTLLLDGGSDKAGFVQVIQGRVTDRDKVRSMVEQSSKMISQYRPDVLGGTLAVDKDGFFTETIAFTSEDEARKNEAKELPPEAQKMFEEEMSLMQDVKYLDLHQPWFSSRH